MIQLHCLYRMIVEILAAVSLKCVEEGEGQPDELRSLD
jgi:hypothetical protein